MDRGRRWLFAGWRRPRDALKPSSREATIGSGSCNAARAPVAIELGGLVLKPGLVDLVDDDRATLYGALLDLADLLREGQAAALREAFRRRGRCAFEAESSEPASATPSREPLS